MLTKNILIISPEAWGKSFVSKHHYASELANQGNMVFFLNPPYNINKVSNISCNLKLIDYKSQFRGLGYLPKAISAFLIKKEVQQLEKLAGCIFDIIWNFDTSRFFNLSQINSKIRICHIVDMAENNQRPLLASTSDICFCTSDFIAQELRPHNSRVYKIHHGYQVPKNYYDVSEEFDASKIQVGYVGNLARPCINWKLIIELIKNHSDVQFNFIGGYKASNLARLSIKDKQLSTLKSFPNVNLLGQKQSHLIPSYLKQFDILLCAYKLESEEDIKQHSNLHKTMEYLASGKTVVTTYTDEYKDKRHLLEMVDKSQNFPRLFAKVVEHIDEYNSPEKQISRIEYAHQHSYEKQLDKTITLLNKHGLDKKMVERNA